MPLDLNADVVTLTAALVDIASESLDEQQIADDVEAALRAHVRHAERLVADVCRRFGLGGSVQVAQGLFPSQAFEFAGARDLVFVEDVVAAALLLLDSAPLTGEVYNVATGAGHTTCEVAEVVSRAMGLTPEFVFTQQIRPGDPERWVADIGRIRALGFAPRFSFDEGVRRTVEWYRMGHDLPVPAGDVSLQAEQKGR